jgi:hypothetical protein
MDYEPTDKDIAQLEDIIMDVRLDGDKDGKELEKQNVAETNYPWHNYIPWLACYYTDCLFYYGVKL